MSSKTTPTIDSTWETVIPMIKHQSEQLIQLIFCRYKMAYQISKRRFLDQNNQPTPPSLSNDNLESNFSRVRQKEQKLSEIVDKDLAELKHLNEISSEHPRCQLIISEAQKSVSEIRNYMAHHQPTLKNIGQGIQNIGALSLDAMKADAEYQAHINQTPTK